MFCILSIQMILLIGGNNMKKNKRNYSSTDKSGKRTQKKYTTLLLLLLVLGVPCAALLTTQVQAENRPKAPTYKYYTSIQVESGDTLWEIAEEYRTEEYEDINSYIEEVKEINHLTSSHITDGMYLCIPYYTTEYKA